ncbi:MAG: SURF1 family protein [Gammaproteobacteria bacterium]|nr:SURF1 family protein [Gammaproteobacteria bacterium]
MVFSSYYFRFSLLGTILGIAGILVFSSLGYWQVERAEYKKNLEQEIVIRNNSPAIALNVSIKDISQNYYRHVKVKGVYDVTHEVLMDNKIHQGEAGYHVYTPLVLDGSDTVIMINRGWLKGGHDRQSIPETSVTGGLIELSGRLHPLPSKPPLVLENNMDPGKRWIYFDAEKYGKITGLKLLPAIILLDKNEVDGYIRDWPKYDAKVSMHIGYSFMWFTFAIIVLVTYIGVNLKKQMVNDVNN